MQLQVPQKGKGVNILNTEEGDSGVDILSDENVLKTIAVTLLQVRDYLATILVSLDASGGQLDRTADGLASIHEAGAVFLPPPYLIDSTIRREDNEPETDGDIPHPAPGGG